MPPEQEADDTASVAPDPWDRRRGERRVGADRRAGAAAAAAAAAADGERRRKERRASDRRAEGVVPERYRAGARHMNEYPLLPEEMEFINAINAYKQKHGRPFPTWSEVLYVLKALGYGKTAADAAPPETT